MADEQRIAMAQVASRLAAALISREGSYSVSRAVELYEQCFRKLGEKPFLDLG